MATIVSALVGVGDGIEIGNLVVGICQLGIAGWYTEATDRPKVVGSAVVVVMILGLKVSLSWISISLIWSFRSRIPLVS